MVIPRTALVDYPNIAIKVGLVIAEYNLLEEMLFYIFAVLTGKHSKDAFIEFYSIRSLNKRIELVQGVANNTLGEGECKALKLLLKRFKSAANRRTEIAHVSYESHNKKPQRVRLIRNNCVVDDLTNELFDRTFTQYHNLGSDLLVFSALAAGSPDPFHRLTDELLLWQHQRTPPVRDPSQHRQDTPTEIDLEKSLVRLKLPFLPFHRKGPG